MRTRADTARDRPERGSSGAWEASPRPGATSWPLALSLAAALGAAGWWGAGAWIGRAARQATADRWAELSTCLLGDGLAPGERPSERLRRIRLDGSSARAGWPARCMEHARALDEALARPSMQRALGALPSAAAALSGTDGAIDLLASALAAAELPRPSPARVPSAPEPLAALFRAADLQPLGPGALDDLEVGFDPDHGRALRLLFANSGAICKIDDGSRWQAAACAPGMAGAERLARAQPGAPAVVYRRTGAGGDGWFDGTSGARLWRPRDPDSQALVRADGTTVVVHALRGSDDSAREHRVVRLRPGRGPASRRLSLPAAAHTLLLPDAVLGWFDGDAGVAVRAYPLRDAERWLGPRSELGLLPRGSRRRGDCASGYIHAVWFAAGARHTLLFREQGMFHRLVDAGAMSGDALLSCHGDAAILLARERGALRRRRCTIEGCTTIDVALPFAADAIHAVAALASELVVVWGNPLRIRQAAPQALAAARDRLLIDDAQHGGIDAGGVRIVSSDGLALLLVEAAGGIAAFALEEGGTPKSLRLVAGSAERPPGERREHETDPER